MEATPRWSLPLLAAGQAQKEMFHNEALTLIDALMHGRAESADVNAPPEDPVPGTCWIVAAGAVGAWAGSTGKIACWTEGGWRFVSPRAGLTFELADRGHGVRHDGDQWRDVAVRADGVYLDDEKVVGTRLPPIAGPSAGATIDVEARATIAAILEAMREHGLIDS